MFAEQETMGKAEKPEKTDLAAAGYQYAPPPDGNLRIGLRVTLEILPPGGRFMTAWEEEQIVRVGDVYILSKMAGNPEIWRVDSASFKETQFACCAPLRNEPQECQMPNPRAGGWAAARSPLNVGHGLLHVGTLDEARDSCHKLQS